MPSGASRATSTSPFPASMPKRSSRAARRSPPRPARPAPRPASSPPMCCAPSASMRRWRRPRWPSAISRGDDKRRLRGHIAKLGISCYERFALRSVSTMSRMQAMSVTDAAALRIKALLAKRGKPSVGIRVGVRSRGCSGLTYTLEYADEKGKFDEVVEDKGVTILIDPKATMFIIGTEMDFVEGKLESGFTFRNPNEKGRCGCGESFHV